MFVFSGVHTSPAMNWKTRWILKAGVKWKVPKAAIILITVHSFLLSKKNNLKENPNINNMLVSDELGYRCMWVYGFFTTFRDCSVLIKWNLYGSSTLTVKKTRNFSYWASNKQKNGVCIVHWMRISKRIAGVRYNFNIELGRQEAKVDQGTSRSKEPNIDWALKHPITSIPFCCYNYSRDGLYFMLMCEKQGYLHFKYSNSLDFMGEVWPLSKKIYLRVYNRCRSK